MEVHNFYSVPAEAPVQYDWSNDFEHACVHWKGHDVADLVRIPPLWYLVSNKTFLRFRSEGDARAHVVKTMRRVEARLRGAS